MIKKFLCPGCAMGAVSYHKKLAEMTGDSVRYVVGLSKQNYRCENCGLEIGAGTTCAALSVWRRCETPEYWWHQQIEEV